MGMNLKPLNIMCKLIWYGLWNWQTPWKRHQKLKKELKVINVLYL